jgi:hypothetical protein
MAFLDMHSALQASYSDLSAAFMDEDKNRYATGV